MNRATETMIRYMQDLYSLEVGALEAVRCEGEASKQASDDGSIQKYSHQTETQAQALENRLSELGAKAKLSDGVANVLLGQPDEWLSMAKESQSKQVMEAVRFYGIAQAKAVSYEGLMSYANAAKDDKTYKLAKSHHEREFSVADQLFDLLVDLVRQDTDFSTASVQYGVAIGA